MAPVTTWLRVGFLDAAGRIDEVRYRLKEEFDDTGSNIDDVLTAVSSLQTDLNALTMDHIEYAYLEIDLAEGNAAPNVAANNQVYAFLRADNDVTGKPTGYRVPAWDDILYHQEPSGLITTPTFNVEADAFLDFLVDPETGDDITYRWGQSRTKKGRVKPLD